MKKIIQTLSIACLLLCFTPLSTYGEGEVIIDLQPEIDESAPDYIGLWQQYQQDLDYFDDLLPGDLVQENFKDDLRDRHPSYGDEAIDYTETAVRLGVRGKRVYEDLRAKLMKFMADEDLPLVVDDSQYATAAPEVYQESDQPLVIQDFKKVVGYAATEKDRAAAAAKAERDAGLTDEKFAKRAQMKKAIAERDWNTIFSYGLFDGKNLTVDDGLGKWAGNDKFKARLYGAVTAIGDRKKFEGALHLWIAEGNFMLAEAYEQYPALQLGFKESGNLAGISANWPLPQRINLGQGKNMVGYVGSVVVPLQIEISDSNQPLKLKGALQAVVCGNHECVQRKLAPQMELKPGVAKPSKVANLLVMAKPYAPQEQNPDLKLTRLVAEPNATKGLPELLRAEFKTGETAAGFDVFITSPDGIAFERPLIRIDGHKVVARFRALETGSLAGKNFVVAARLKPEITIRTTQTAEKAPLFDLEGRQLSLGLIWLGFVGGFLLNLMPCVFPVLSLKLMSFTTFGAQDGRRIRSGALFNILGIFTSFAIMTGALIALKVLGRAVGWGMQFQNVYFLTFIIFVVAAFLAHVWGLISFHTPKVVEKAIAAGAKRDYLLQFLTGLFLVLLSTPCTAPYLGTALGFALAGTVTDIVLMMTAVGLGLSIPYILLAAVPELTAALPKPGPWVGRINLIMATLLVLTLVWLISILYAQTSSAVTLHFSLFLLGFWMVLWFRKLLMEVVDGLSENATVVAKVRRFFNGVVLMLLLILFVGALFDAHYYYQQRRRFVAASTVSQMVSPKVIERHLQQNKIVLVRVGADWCLTCVYNDAAVFNSATTDDLLEDNNVVTIDVDWTRYDPEVLTFMEKFGRRGLPFYVVFSPRIPDGLVLPEIITDREFRELIENLRY